MGVLALPAVLSCGASMRGLYEGDVRFEHCMSVDTLPDVKPTIRRVCWEEWKRFYTFGQTRDRIDHANQRIQQLSGASDFDEADWAPSKSNGPSALPDPTSALAPPPMLVVHDAGLADAGPPSVGAAAVVCALDCEHSLTICRKECKSPACDKACVARNKRCTKHCE